MFSSCIRESRTSPAVKMCQTQHWVLFTSCMCLCEHEGHATWTPCGTPRKCRFVANIETRDMFCGLNGCGKRVRAPIFAWSAANARDYPIDWTKEPLEIFGVQLPTLFEERSRLLNRIVVRVQSAPVPSLVGAVVGYAAIPVDPQPVGGTMSRFSLNDLETKQTRTPTNMKRRFGEIDKTGGGAKEKRRHTARPAGGKDYWRMNVAQLREELQRRKLRVSGLKADLIQRLAENDRAVPGAVPVEAAAGTILPPANHPLRTGDTLEAAAAPAPSLLDAVTPRLAAPPPPAGTWKTVPTAAARMAGPQPTGIDNRPAPRISLVRPPGAVGVHGEENSHDATQGPDWGSYLTSEGLEGLGLLTPPFSSKDSLTPPPKWE